MATILLIDDNPDSRTVVGAAMNSSFPDFLLHHAQSGPAGLSLARETVPDVIILDVIMPGMDGYETCRRIKHDPLLQDVPVLFLTAMEDRREYRLLALEAGAEAFLTTPIDLTQFTVMIRIMLKIRAANRDRRTERERLEILVDHRTQELEERTRELEERTRELEERTRELEERTRELEERKQELEKRTRELEAQILERIEYETKLRESEELFESMFMAANAGKTITKVTGELTPNHAFCEMLGYTREEMLGKSWMELTHADDMALTREHLHRVLSGEAASTRFEKRFIRKDGSTVWGDVSTVLMRDAGGQPEHFITTIVDITERRRVEDALSASEVRFAQVAEHSRSMSWEVDADGLYTHFSGLSEAFIGYTPEELVGRLHFYDIAPEADREELKAAAFAAFAQRTSFVNFENRIQTRNHGIIWVSTNGFPIHDEHGRFAGYRGSDTDITKRKLAEEKLNHSYELLRRLTERVPGVVYQYLLRADGTSCFPYASPGIWDIYRVTPEDVVEDASPVFARLHPDDYQLIVDAILASARDLSPFHAEFRVQLPDHGVEWRMCDAEPERTDEGGTLWHGIITDITTRKNTEVELRAAKDKAEESDRLKTAFLMNMSHEIRTPMNGILGCLDLLAEPDVTDGDKAQYIDIINRSGTRLLTTIEDILEISRIEAGEAKVVPEPVCVPDILQFQRDFFRAQAEEKGIELMMVESSPGTSQVLHTDRHMLESILINLIRNAIKFTDRGGIEIGCHVIDRAYIFHVKDTGVGIPADRLDAIFNRFEQADVKGNRNRRYEGSGLGLSIVKSHLELLGGSVWAESEPGVGSTFWFAIPSMNADGTPDDSYLPNPDVPRTLPIDRADRPG